MHDLQTRQRFILERPRLIDLLDSIEARIVLITAPAGYGKTTLARQWAAKRDDVLWYEATAASRDVAALAVDLARVCRLDQAEVDALRTTLDSHAKPDAHCHELATELTASLQRAWPNSAPTLVIDEHEVLAESHAEELLARLIQGMPLRAFVIGRQRPAWASTRKLLYGEMFEVDRPTLEFSEAEAYELLSGLPVSTIKTLWMQAQGWPAVLRLAALTHSATPPGASWGNSLHQYFADELLDHATPQLRDALAYITVVGRLDSTSIPHILGSESSALTAEAVEIGFLSTLERNKFALHPLLREFLEHKLGALRTDDRCASIVHALLKIRYWDDAFQVIKRARLPGLLPGLIEASLDQLLAQGRISTLEDWLKVGRSWGISDPAVLLLDAELARRSGELDRAKRQAVHAARRYERSNHQWSSRAYTIAGLSASLTLSLPEAADYQRRARLTAQTKEDSRRAAWGLFSIHQTLGETNEAIVALREYDDLIDGEPLSQLRSASGHLYLAATDGPIETASRGYTQYLPLCDTVDDSFVTSSFLYQLGFANALAGRYAASLEIVAQAEERIRSERLRFAAAHVAAARIAATTGLRKFRRAEQLITEMMEISERLDDAYERVNARGLQARLCLDMGDWEQAADVLRDWESAPAPPIRSELAALRALALAQGDDIETAEALARRALSLSSDTQAQTLARATQATIDLRAGQRRDSPRLRAFAEVLSVRQNFDSLVHCVSRVSTAAGRGAGHLRRHNPY